MLSRLTDTDRQRLTAVLEQLAPPSRATLQQIIAAAATFDARPLPGMLPLLGPTLHLLPPDSCTTILARVVQLAQVFPGGVTPLFRTLSKVYDEGGTEGTLAWIAAGEAIAQRNPEAGIAFFTLRSRTSLLTLRGMSPAVYLHDVQGVLLKYLHMLSRAPVVLSETDTPAFPPPLAEDGVTIPLPFCSDQFATYEENFRLYRVLVALHAGRSEFGTYTFFLPDLWPALSPFVFSIAKASAACPEHLPGYFQLFPRPDLIEALFLTIEGKRVTARLCQRYPGLQTDLHWAETFTALTQPTLAALLTHVPATVWSQLEKDGTVDHSLVLATRLYAEFLRAETKNVSVTQAPGTAPDEECSDGMMAFLTGVELEGGEDSELLIGEAAPEQRRRALTVADLRYLYDEWDYAIEDYRPHWCELREVALQNDYGAFFSATVSKYAALVQDVKREFQRLRPRMYQPVKGLEDGEEIDLNAVVAAHIDRRRGVSPSPKLYTARELIERDVAVLFLVDVSASTAALPGTTSTGKSQGQSAIELMKESLVVLSGALEEIGDAYAIYGFSSNGRFDVEVYPVKTFRDTLSGEVQGRIGSLTPRGGTRMGAAVRHATRRLKGLSSRTKLLVLLSDGYPEDAGYGKPVTPPVYGLRDTRMALNEAERSGILPFCLTIDKSGRDYLRDMCPSARYLVIDNVQSLPQELPKIYQRYIRVQS